MRFQIQREPYWLRVDEQSSSQKDIMKYQKGFQQIQREKASRRLREDLFFLLGLLGFVILLALVGGVAR